MPGADQAIAHLARQLAEPIMWMDCMDAFAEQGITAALELGPGSALSRMLAARHGHIECRSAADFRTLDGIKRWLERI
jgi:[acyl-carrier-protein] S-malonyltransferase